MASPQEIVNSVNRIFGGQAVALASDPRFEVKYLPTGVLPVDMLLEGGLPFGRFVEFYGDYSTLKSYVGYMSIASAQRAGKIAALIDTEKAFDPEWARKLGVDLKNLIYWPPKGESGPVNAERAIDVAESFIRGGVDLIVFDSVAAALPKAEEELQLSGGKTVQPARQAALMSLACRKLTAGNRGSCILWVNQTRMSIGVMFGNPETTPGGKALGFYASMRIGFRKAGKVTDSIDVYVPDSNGKPVKKSLTRTVGQKIRITLEKSKLNKPHQEGQFIFSLNTGGVDNWSYLANMCLSEGLVGKNQGGFWWVAGESQKSRLSDFRGRVDEMDLVKLLKTKGIEIPEEFLGASPRGKKKVSSRKNGSSAKGVPGSTRVRAQAGSSKTVRIKKR